MLNCVVNNELGQFRSHSNMALISMMLYTWADEAAKVRPTLTCPEREGERGGRDDMVVYSLFVCIYMYMYVSLYLLLTRLPPPSLHHHYITQLLGGIFQDFLTRKEDYLRALRGFLREIVRVMKNDFSFTTFTRSLMQERSEPAFVQADQPHKVSRPSTVWQYYHRSLIH